MLNDLHQFYKDLKQEGVMFCFSGPTSQSVVEGIGRTLRLKMELEEAGMNTIHRVFSLFVEQMQNIVNYSSEQTSNDNGGSEELRHGIVVVGRSHGKFYVICGNYVSKDQSLRMLERIRYLEGLTKQELKEYYKRVRRQEPDPESRGAGLGFIEMFRRVSEPLEYHLAPIDAQTVFFTIKAIG